MDLRGRILGGTTREGVWPVVLIAAGRSKNGPIYTAEELRRATEAGMFEGRPAKAHPTMSADGAALNVSGGAAPTYDHVGPDDMAGKCVGNVVGHYENTRWNESERRVEGDLVLATDLPEAKALDERFRALEASGSLESLGLSIDGEATVSPGGRASLHLIDTIDIVTHPAAGGRINHRIAASVQKGRGMNRLELLKGRFPRLVEGYTGEDNTTLLAAHIASRVSESEVCASDLAMGIGRAGDTRRIFEMEDKSAVLRDAITLLESLLSAAPAEESEDDAERTEEADDSQESVADAAPSPELEAVTRETEGLKAESKRQADELKRLKIEASAPILRRACESRKLPANAIDKIVAENHGKVISENEAARIAESHATVLDMVLERNYGGSVEMREDGMERLTESLAHLFAPNFVEKPKGHDDSVFTMNRFIEKNFLSRRQSSRDLRISESYHQGRSSRRRLKEAVDDTNFSNVFEDALYRALLATYEGQTPYNDYGLLCNEVPYGDFRTNNVINVGYYANLPTVAKGGTYTALTTPTDRKEQIALAKKGGIETITMEDMLNDDIGLWQTIISRIGQAAMETRYESTMAVIRSATQPTMADTEKLTSATRGNQGTAALTADAAGKTALVNSIVAMMKGTGNGGVAKGVQPRFLVVPFELVEAAAYVTAALKAGNTGTDVPDATARALSMSVPEIVIDYGATDTNDWFLLADPSRAEVLRFGTLGGRNAPDIFIADDERFGAMFTKDQIELKVRDIFQVAAVDPLGIYGNVVA